MSNAPTKPSIAVVAVIIPAHNEEDGIAATLASVSAAARRSPVPVLTVVVLDSCSDSTADVVGLHRTYDQATEWHVIRTAVRRASTSRGVGVDYVVGRLHHISATRVAVLSTDADSTVPDGWISDHLAELNVGIDAIAGVVELAVGTHDGVCENSWRAEYATSFKADGSHAHVHCANLAVRLDVLIAAGGFGTMRRAEDIDLWKRLKKLDDITLTSNRRSVVMTSGRIDGRVVGGFATALKRFPQTIPRTPIRSA